MCDGRDICLDDQIEEVDRELRMRIEVYKRRVEGRQMTRERAERQVARMAAVRASLTRLKGMLSDGR